MPHIATTEAIATAQSGAPDNAANPALLTARLAAELVKQTGEIKRLLAGGVGGGFVEAVDIYTLSDADNGKVIQIGTLSEAEAWIYLDENAPPSDGFSCSIIAVSTDVKVGWNGVTGNIHGPGMANGKWLINDATNNGVGMAATLVVKNSSVLVAHIIGAVELIP